MLNSLFYLTQACVEIEKQSKMFIALSFLKYEPNSKLRILPRIKGNKINNLNFSYCAAMIEWIHVLVLWT